MKLFYLMLIRENDRIKLISNYLLPKFQIQIKFNYLIYCL